MTCRTSLDQELQELVTQHGTDSCQSQLTAAEFSPAHAQEELAWNRSNKTGNICKVVQHTSQKNIMLEYCNRTATNNQVFLLHVSVT